MIKQYDLIWLNWLNQIYVQLSQFVEAKASLDALLKMQQRDIHEAYIHYDATLIMEALVRNEDNKANWGILQPLKNNVNVNLVKICCKNNFF